jgi:hypothetical protein
LIFLTVISALIATSMSYVVFSDMGPKAGLWDDLAFVTASLVFLWAFVRMLRDRAIDLAEEARRSDTQRYGQSRGSDSRWTDTGRP